MKRFAFHALLLAFAAMSFFLTACDDDDEEDQQLEPTITFDNTGGALTADDSLDVDASVSFILVVTKGNDGPNLDRVVLEVLTPDATGGTEFVRIPEDRLQGVSYASATENFVNTGNEAAFSISIQNFVLNLAGTYVFRFTAIDRDGNRSNRVINVVVTAPQGGNVDPPRSFSLANMSVSGSAFANLTAGTAVNETDATASAANINFRLIYSSANTRADVVDARQLATAGYDGIAGVEFDAGSGSQGIAFRTSSLTAANVDTITNENSLQALVMAGSLVPSSVNNDAGDRTGIAAGDVFGFMAGGKHGFMVVESVNLDGSNTGANVRFVMEK